MTTIAHYSFKVIHQINRHTREYWEWYLVWTLLEWSKTVQLQYVSISSLPIEWYWYICHHHGVKPNINKSINIMTYFANHIWIVLMNLGIQSIPVSYILIVTYFQVVILLFIKRVGSASAVWRSRTGNSCCTLIGVITDVSILWPPLKNRMPKYFTDVSILWPPLKNRMPKYFTDVSILWPPLKNRMPKYFTDVTILWPPLKNRMPKYFTDVGILWPPLKNRMPKYFINAIFEHPVSKCWYRPCPRTMGNISPAQACMPNPHTA